MEVLTWDVDRELVSRLCQKEQWTEKLHTSTLMMEAVCTSETPITPPTSTRCHNPGTELITMMKAESGWCVTSRIISEADFPRLAPPGVISYRMLEV